MQEDRDCICLRKDVLETIESVKGGVAVRGSKRGCIYELCLGTEVTLQSPKLVTDADPFSVPCEDHMASDSGFLFQRMIDIWQLSHKVDSLEIPSVSLQNRHCFKE